MNSYFLEKLSLHLKASNEAAIQLPVKPKPRRSWKEFLQKQNGSKVYVCNFETCKKPFKHLSSLIKHERIHRNERLYACKVCGQRFVQSSNLRRHEKVHTGERNYPCSHCDKKFSTPSNLRQHSQIHTDEPKRKHFNCETCGSSYLYLSSLSKHAKSCQSQANHELTVKNDDEPSLQKIVKIEDKLETNSSENTPGNQILDGSKINNQQLLLTEKFSSIQTPTLGQMNYSTLNEPQKITSANNIAFQNNSPQRPSFSPSSIFSIENQILGDLALQQLLQNHLRQQALQNQLAQVQSLTQRLSASRPVATHMTGLGEMVSYLQLQQLSRELAARPGNFLLNRLNGSHSFY